MSNLLLAFLFAASMAGLLIEVLVFMAVKNRRSRTATEMQGVISDMDPYVAEDALGKACRLIANSYGGDWDRASEEWCEAAERWRDNVWFRFLEEQGRLKDPNLIPMEKQPPPGAEYVSTYSSLFEVARESVIFDVGTAQWAADIPEELRKTVIDCFLFDGLWYWLVKK